MATKLAQVSTWLQVSGFIHRLITLRFPPFLTLATDRGTYSDTDVRHRSIVASSKHVPVAAAVSPDGIPVAIGSRVCQSVFQQRWLAQWAMSPSHDKCT